MVPTNLPSDHHMKQSVSTTTKHPLHTSTEAVKHQGCKNLFWGVGWGRVGLFKGCVNIALPCHLANMVLSPGKHVFVTLVFNIKAAGCLHTDLKQFVSLLLFLHSQWGQMGPTASADGSTGQ